MSWILVNGVVRAAPRLLPVPVQVVRTPITGGSVSRLFAALTRLPVAGAAQQSGLDRLIHRTTLENGLEVVVAETRAVPLATVLVAVRNGSFTQDSLDAGLAHLYEHLLFHSFGRDPSAFGYEVSKLN